MNLAIHWSGALLIVASLALASGIAWLSLRPVIGQVIAPGPAALMLLVASLLVVALPAMYAAQAEATGAFGLVGHALLTIGVLLLVLVAAPSLLDPSAGSAVGEGVAPFALGICLTLGLLLTGIATFQADVFPRPAAVLILAAFAGFLFVFFVAEFLPSVFGQIGAAVFGLTLAAGLFWIGWTMWSAGSV